MGLITLEQAAKLTGFTPGALRTRRWRGDLPFPLYKASDGHWRADEAEVREWIEKTKREGAVR
jgi:hypothetical protein